MLVRRVTLNLLYLLLLVSTTQASFVNVSIDDTYGDATTGQKPVYQPSGPWAGLNCAGCAIVPSTASAFDGTWTAATYHPNIGDMSITFSFTGVSIWVFFILANANSIGPAITTNTNCNFTLDGNLMGSFNHDPDMSTYNLQYNATVFSASGLTNTQHTLLISTNDYPNSTFINFDYAIYTMDDSVDATSSNSGSSPTGHTGPIIIGASSATPSTTSSSPRYSSSGVTGGIVGTSSTPSAEAVDDSSDSSHSKSGIVVGSVFGSLAFVGVVALLMFFRRLGKKRGPSGPIITTFNRQPPSMRISHLPWQRFVYNRNPRRGSDLSDLTSECTLVPVRREPFISSTKSRDELRAVRQIEINQRLQSAEQEMHNLTSRQLTLHGGTDTSSEQHGRQEAEHEMGCMRDQILELRAQIEQLQAERSSDWAEGLCDMPPPAYY